MIEFSASFHPNPTEEFAFATSGEDIQAWVLCRRAIAGGNASGRRAHRAVDKLEVALQEPALNLELVQAAAAVCDGAEPRAHRRTKLYPGCEALALFRVGAT